MSVKLFERCASAQSQRNKQGFGKSLLIQIRDAQQRLTLKCTQKQGTCRQISVPAKMVIPKYNVLGSPPFIRNVAKMGSMIATWFAFSIRPIETLLTAFFQFLDPKASILLTLESHSRGVFYIQH